MNSILHVIYLNFTISLCVLVFISRLGDLLSTLLVTPNLRLESNFLVKKLGKPLMFSSLLLSLAPLYDPRLGVLILIPSMLVTANNFSKLWAVRTMGEDAYHNQIQSLVKKSKIQLAITSLALHSVFFALIGFVVYILYPQQGEWGFWISMGFFLYAFIVVLHNTIFYVRLFKKLKQG